MTLLIVLVLVTLVLFTMFLGGGLIAQGYLYQSPAERLPLRALAAAALVGLFLTMWVWIDQKNPRKYDTFFEFAPYETKTFDDMEAIRWVSPDGSKLQVDPSGNPVEVVVKFKRGVGEKKNIFLDDAGEPFQLNSSGKTGVSYMTAAIKMKPAPDLEAIRFDAQLTKDKRTYVNSPDGRKFIEERGSRYVNADQLGVVYVPTTGTVIVALFINFVHFVVWFVAFWLILQFSRGHSAIMAGSFGLITMLLVLPLLFGPNRKPKTPEEAPKVATRTILEPTTCTERV
ncbi:MAG: hypothetical protein C0467_04975 [Planctomycetaceae bacterium]|nr:hypothetical protein [Planctomycetaceae bacterium]